MQFRENVPLAPLTTFKIGGPARWFAEATTEPDLLEAVDFARTRSLPLFILGGGSNLLVSDVGFPGLVIHVALQGISESSDGPDRIFTVSAGEDWDHFVTHTVGRGCGGIECLAGIPGTVGGTPVQNVGAYGQEVATTIETVRALDLSTGQFVNLTPTDCAFVYRKSIFNTTARGRYIVSAVTYRLSTQTKPTLTYADIKRYFTDTPTPNLPSVAAAVREIRHRKGMLIVPGDPDCKSAGSFFKNPIVPDDLLHHIQKSFTEQATPRIPAIPTYPAGPGFSKIPAAWLLEQAGFSKGFALGNAGISTRHTLALINRGSASAAEIIALKDLITTTVKELFGITLEPEPVWVA